MLTVCPITMKQNFEGFFSCSVIVYSALVILDATNKLLLNQFKTEMQPTLHCVNTDPELL